jgi:uncharacterized protein GlcG (DUF336 family)
MVWARSIPATRVAGSRGDAPAAQPIRAHALRVRHRMRKNRHLPFNSSSLAMTPLKLQQAQTLINAAMAEARTRGFNPMGVVVVDSAGQVKAMAREDGASALRLDIATGKACAAVGMGASSRVLTQRAKDLPAFFISLASASSQKFIAQTGAVLIKDNAGEVIGAAGASGGTGDEDEAICIAGIAAAGLGHG